MAKYRNVYICKKCQGGDCVYAYETPTDLTETALKSREKRIGCIHNSDIREFVYSYTELIGE